MPPTAPDRSQAGLFGAGDPPRPGPHERNKPTAPRFSRYVSVAIDQGLPVDPNAPVAMAGTLTYGLPDDAGTRVGDRVRVPLARRTVEGWAVAVGGAELLGGVDPARIRPIRETVPASLPEGLVELASWTARYYQAPLGATLAGIVPAAVKAQTGARERRVLEPIDPVPDPLPRLAPTAREAWETLVSSGVTGFPMTARDLADRLGLRTVAPISRLIREGLLAERSERFIKAPEMFAHRAQAPSGTHAPERPPEPTEQQRAVTEGIAGALGSFSAHLIRGVTGSGKTEVYLRLVGAALERGRTCIVLVPEISLTPQTVGRFLARFRAAGVAVLHSALPASVRNQQWHAARAGDARVVVGARSAIFAPCTDVGLIVVDEEHDASYKQEQAPRYHARDVAIKRAQLEGCPVVLGSATPSLETWARARTETGPRPGAEHARVRCWRMDRRVGNARMPEVRLVDMVTDRPVQRAGAAGAHQGILTPTLTEAIRHTLDEGAQAILMLNRRGLAGFLCCADTRCGWRLTCESCDTSLVLHEHRRRGASRRFLRCHHCLHEQLVPERCPACAKPLARLNPGTQSAQRELEEVLLDHGLDPGTVLRRVDTDSMRSGRAYFETLDAFGRGDIRVLLGTQMLAKGLDFPGVRLVGVLNADIALGMPEYRAAERTFQLICQVAGRAGRGDHPGLVLVQTGAPDDPVIRLAASGDYEAFAEQELSIRAQLGYPPAMRQVRVIARHTDPDRARDDAAKVGAVFREHLPDGGRVEGPMPAVISRINERYRFTVDLFAASAAAAQRTLAAADRAGVIHPSIDQVVDVDPLSLL